MFIPSYVQHFSFNVNEIIQRVQLKIKKSHNIGIMVVTY